MIERRFTPGPWDCGPIKPMQIKDGVAHVEHEDPPELYAVRHRFRDEQGRRCTRFIADVHMTRGHETECPANANLIAAAPDLYAALEPFVFGDPALEQILWGDFPDDATGTITVRRGDFKRAREALAKAKGSP